jgi:hypothetical protein
LRKQHRKELLLTRIYHQYYSVGQIKKNEMSGACDSIWMRRGAYSGKENLREGDNLIDVGVDGRIILK